MDYLFVTAITSVVLHHSLGAWSGVGNTDLFCLETNCEKSDCPAVNGLDVTSDTIPLAKCPKLKPFEDEPDEVCEDTGYDDGEAPLCRSCYGVCHSEANHGQRYASFCKEETEYCLRSVSKDKDLFCIDKCGEVETSNLKTACRTVLGKKECDRDYFVDSRIVNTNDGKVCAGPCNGGECLYVEWIQEDGEGYKLRNKTGSCTGEASVLSSSTGTILGVVVGGVFVVALLGLVGRYICNKNKGLEPVPT